MSLRISPAVLRAGGLLAALVLGATLAGCGKLGELDRPGPLFGRAKPATATTAQAPQGEDPSRPVQTIDPRDENVTPEPSRSAPIQGSGQSPFGSQPPGALPDPYAQPR